MAWLLGMASPLIGIAAQNSLLFTAFQTSKRLVSSSPNLTISQTVAAGALAGAVNSVMASPIELLKIRMQSQYGGTADRKLRQVAAQLWREHGFRRGIMRGFWVRAGRREVVDGPVMLIQARPCAGHGRTRDARLCWLLRRLHQGKG